MLRMAITISVFLTLKVSGIQAGMDSRNEHPCSYIFCDLNLCMTALFIIASTVQQERTNTLPAGTPTPPRKSLSTSRSSLDHIRMSLSHVPDSIR